MDEGLGRISEFLPGLELRITIFQFLALSRSLLQDLHSDVRSVMKFASISPIL